MQETVKEDYEETIKKEIIKYLKIHHTTSLQSDNVQDKGEVKK